MEEKILAALLDLQIVLGRIQGVMSDLDQAVSKLIAVQLEALESKTGRATGTTLGNKKEGSGLSPSSEPPTLQ